MKVPVPHRASNLSLKELLTLLALARGSPIEWEISDGAFFARAHPRARIPDMECKWPGARAGGAAFAPFQSLSIYPMPFQKGHTLGMKGPMRHDTTIELITQLNEMTKSADGHKRTKLHRLMKNLITKARDYQSPRRQTISEDRWSR
jgi:hypothetical protein